MNAIDLCSPNGNTPALFVVSPDTTPAASLQQVSIFLDTAYRTLNDLTGGEDDHGIFASMYLIDFSRSLVDAMLQEVSRG